MIPIDYIKRVKQRKKEKERERERERKGKGGRGEGGKLKQPVEWVRPIK